MPHVVTEMVEEWATETQKEAKENIIGRTSPLPATGEFPAWEDLLDSTIRAKERAGLGKGGDPYSILYASGDLYESIEKTVEGNHGAVGSDLPYAAVHEYGSLTVPPRAFLGPASAIVLARLYTKFQKKLKRTLEGKS